MNAGRPILIAEDDARDLELLTICLREAGANRRIEVVQDGEEALDWLLRKGAHAGRTGPDPCLVILELKMPKVDGRAVLRALRADPEVGAVPVLVFSSSALRHDLQEAYRLGASAYLVKPLDFVEYRRVVQAAWTFWGTCNLAP